ncbi:ATP-binding protein [Haloglomus litoreum]|uniref:sensor histidine kinase n=1 Tax=Haloglomus litoreum TaxID=3034026 RepID=UPI0023E832CA|nr:ATP-binding protein [Haloglomus sp. DT116]
MAAHTHRGGYESGGTLSVPELAVYAIAIGYAVAGGLLALAAEAAGEPWLLTAAASVGPPVLVLVGALALRRTGYSWYAWRVVSGWYVASIGVATAALAWLVVGGVGAVWGGPGGVPALVPSTLGVGSMVVAGSLGGAPGFAAGVWRARAVRRRRAPTRLLGAVDQAAWLFDADRSRTLYVNPGYEGLFGRPATELESDPTALLQAVHPDDREELRTQLDALAEGTPIEIELRVDPEGGYTRWAWLSGRPLYRDGRLDALACIARDITTRRTHRERLVSLHDATRRLFRAETEAEAARIATEAAEEVLGLRANTIWLYDGERDELVPTAATDAADADERSLPTFKSGDSLAWEVFESGEPQVYDDVRTAPGGKQAPTRSEVILPLGEFGVFMAGSTTTERFEGWQVSLGKVLAANVEVALARIDRTRALEESRRALQQRNERLDEFTSVVSHDLRNPLAVARGHLEFVREESDSESVGKIDAALQRMETLIDDLLTLAREGEAIDELQRVDLAAHAEQCWNGVETDGGRLRIDGGGTVMADSNRLAQLFENLFRNSVEHGSTDERVTAEDRDAGDQQVADGGSVTVTVGMLPDGDGFYVEDDGPGIPADQREAVFEAGYSTASEGTGFGLSIVQTIAEAHGWTITATEGSDGGARFEIRGVSMGD